MMCWFICQTSMLLLFWQEELKMLIKLRLKKLFAELMYLLTHKDYYTQKRNKYDRYLYCYTKLKSSLKNNKFFVIGDSHTDIFCSNTIDEKVPLGKGLFGQPIMVNFHNYPNIITYHLGPCTAYKLSGESSTQGQEKLDYLINEGFLPEKSKVICVFGEIDCRIHIKKQADKQGCKVEKIIDEVIANYGNFLNRLKKRGYEVIAYAPVAQLADSLDYIKFGTQEERNKITIDFTKKLSEFCKKNEIKFISILDELLNKDMTTRDDLYRDGVHLNDKAIKLIADKLNSFYPYPKVTIVSVIKDLIKNNRKDFFEQMVASVQMQDYPNIEHLIIDGASTDGTVEMLKKMGLNYISEPDSGIHDATNKGIRRAKGEYIALLCSDDFYKRADAISTLVNLAEKNKADLAASSVAFVDNQGQTLNIKKPDWKKALVEPPFLTLGILWSKKMLNEVGYFDESYLYSADFALINTCILSGKRLSSTDECLVCFRDGGVSNTLANKIKAEDIRLIERTCGISHNMAVLARDYRFLMPHIMYKLLSRTNYPNKYGAFIYNLKNLIKFIRKQLFELRTRKGKRCFRLFGITFYQEEKL